MNGLKCKEIYLSNILQNKDFRVDSDFYTSLVSKNSKLQYIPIKECLIQSQYGISINMNETGVGYPIYRMNEIHNMICDIDVSKYAEISQDDLKKFKLNDRDVLFNRTNSYELVGRTGIYYEGMESRVFASYLVRFVTDPSKILPEFFTTYLNTKYGIKNIKRHSRQSINQTNVNPEEIKEIEIPLLNKDIQLMIEKTFNKAYKMLLQAEGTYNNTARLLLNYLLVPQNLSNNNISIKNISKSFNLSGRLDSEYYLPKYDELFMALKNQTTKNLGGKDGIVTIKKSIEPGSDVYCENGIPFIRVSDITKFEIKHPEIHLPYSIVNDIKSLFPKKDTILFSKDGTIGIAYKVEDDTEVITSGALLHLIVKNPFEILPDYLTLVLNSPIVQLQAERDSNGAIIQHWKPSEIEKVTIPILDMERQRHIAEMVQKSFAYRRQSKQLLDYAKQAVEMAIEQNEETALDWLKDKTCSYEVEI